MIDKKFIKGIILVSILLVVTVFTPMIQANNKIIEKQRFNDDEISIMKQNKMIFKDNTPPTITDVNYPYIVIVPSSVIISAVVTDDVAVEDVKLNINLPTGTLNQSMVKQDNNVYSYELYLFFDRNYDFFIWAIDTSGNANRTVTYTIDGELSGTPENSISLGQLTVVWENMGIFPGLGDTRFIEFEEEKHESINCSCVDGKAFIDEMWVGWQSHYEHSYNHDRYAEFSMNCYLDSKDGKPLNGEYQEYLASEKDGFGILSAKNIEIECNELKNRSIYCKLEITPKIIIKIMDWPWEIKFTLPWSKPGVEWCKVVLEFERELEADANGPYEGTVGEPVQFNGSAICGLPPYNWTWDFGDEIGKSYEQNPTYVYENPGNYIATLRIEDSVMTIDEDIAVVIITG